MNAGIRLAVALFITGFPLAAFSDTPEKMNSYLCDTQSAAIAFTVAEAAGTEETARDVVNKQERREACNRYVGLATVEDQSVATINGVAYKTTKYRMRFWDHRGDLFAWLAERI